MAVWSIAITYKGECDMSQEMTRDCYKAIKNILKIRR